MTFLTFQKAWHRSPARPSSGVARPTARYWTVWWHPKTISEHFEPLSVGFSFSLHPSLASLLLFFFKFVLEITKKIFIGQEVGAAKTEKLRVGQMDTENQRAAWDRLLPWP